MKSQKDQIFLNLYRLSIKCHALPRKYFGSAYNFHRLRLCLPRHKYPPVFWSRFLPDLNIYLYALHLLFYVLSLALLPFPLVTKGDDLISKFAQVFVRSTLIVLNYRFQTLAGCKKSDISTALFWFLLDAFS